MSLPRHPEVGWRFLLVCGETHDVMIVMMVVDGGGSGGVFYGLLFSIALP